MRSRINGVVGIAYLESHREENAPQIPVFFFTASSQNAVLPQK
jgi:hypothetical protein